MNTPPLTRTIGFRVRNDRGRYWTAPTHPEEWTPPSDTIEAVRCQIIRLEDVTPGTLGYLDVLSYLLYTVTSAWEPVSGLDLEAPSRVKPLVDPYGGRRLGIVTFVTADQNRSKLRLVVPSTHCLIVPVGRVV